MKVDERYDKANQVIDYIDQKVPDHKDKFYVLMTALTVFFARSDPVFDQLIDGIETELYRIVKTVRAAQEKEKKNE